MYRNHTALRSSLVSSLCLALGGSVLGGCGLVKIQTPGGTTSLSTTGAEAAPAPDHPESPKRLEARHCELLAKETAPLTARLATFQPSGKPLDDLAVLVKIRREADEKTRAVQTAFDGAYEESSRKNTRHPDYPRDYTTTNNTSRLGTSLVAVQATARYLELAAKLGAPPSQSGEWLKTDERIVDGNACVTPELVDARKAARAEGVAKVVDLDALKQDFAAELPIKAGDLIAFGGDVASVGKSLVVRREHGNQVLANCRDTNKVDRIENGRVEYVRTCDRAGGIGLVIAVKVTPPDAAAPFELRKLAVKDRVWLRGRVVRYVKSDKRTAGNVVTTVNDIEIEPTVITNVDRAGKSLFAF